MTVDASRSCLGLGTCVGSATRQIVDARVLLTAAVPPALPGSSVSGGSLAPPCDAITIVRSARCWRYAPGDGPDEACQFTRDRGGDDIGRFAGAGELAIARAQPQLCFPGDVADRLWQFFLAQQQLTADARWEAVTPRRLDQQSAGGAVAGFGQAAAPDAGAARMLRGYQAEIGHQLARIGKA